MSALVDEILEAHGGAARWRKIEQVVMRGAVVGELWPRRGLEGLLADANITLDAARQASTYQDYGAKGQVGHFTPARVWITDAEGEALEVRDDPEGHFAAQDMKEPWDRLDALFANGYGTWTEVLLPRMLTLPGVETRALSDGADRRGRGRRLAVDFPKDILTHKDTVLWIGDDGRIERAEFTPAVGGVVPSAVFWSEYRTFDGLSFPTRRAMVPIKDGQPQDDPVMLDEHDLTFEVR